MMRKLIRKIVMQRKIFNRKTNPHIHTQKHIPSNLTSIKNVENKRARSFTRERISCKKFIDLTML